ncbi:MAG TPA: PIN domain-containing protein [Candidatus Paceibacterota bacterium]
MATSDLGSATATSGAFIDTNVILRFFVRDNERMYNECKAFFGRIEKGEIRAYTSAIVLLELAYVLLRTYRYSRAEAATVLSRIFSLRNLALVERTNARSALELWKQHGIKYGDCLIASQIPKNSVLVTYDAEFKKIEGLRAMTPDQFVT